ncbi:hypothetical protein Tsubulata_007846 [Turnera subulata]|uniref:Uncharacterized protein n=1 Tax=Turnera subulata TaxID=218843 RepID=A0A9Q0J5G5_9ROSI|nr:hypothetical protein Tsubulata_007846 [Turnera subulata]
MVQDTSHPKDCHISRIADGVKLISWVCPASVSDWLRSGSFFWVDDIIMVGLGLHTWSFSSFWSRLAWNGVIFQDKVLSVISSLLIW